MSDADDLNEAENIRRRKRVPDLFESGLLTEPGVHLCFICLKNYSTSRCLLTSELSLEDMGTYLREKIHKKTLKKLKTEVRRDNIKRACCLCCKCKECNLKIIECDRSGGMAATVRQEGISFINDGYDIDNSSIYCNDCNNSINDPISNTRDCTSTCCVPPDDEMMSADESAWWDISLAAYLRNTCGRGIGISIFENRMQMEIMNSRFIAASAPKIVNTKEETVVRSTAQDGDPIPSKVRFAQREYHSVLIAREVLFRDVNGMVFTK